MTYRSVEDLRMERMSWLRRNDRMLHAVTDNDWCIVFAPSMDEGLEHVRAKGVWPKPEEEPAAIAAGRWLRITEPTETPEKRLPPLTRGNPPPP